MPFPRGIIWLLVIGFVLSLPIRAAAAPTDLIDEVEALARISAVTGRELEAAEFIKTRLGDPRQLRRRVTFAWSVQEEVGMAGAMRLVDRFQQADRVYPVDTFVSSDAPLEDPGFARCRLGEGAVIRVLESINFAPRRSVDHLLRLAGANDIPVQIGMTSGGTDGQSFLAHGIVSLPISWPGRYSHSPIEVLDFRDLDALVELIQAIARDDP